MTAEWLTRLLSAMIPVDDQAYSAAAARQNQLIKPQGSLGLLEMIANRLAAIQGVVRPRITGKAVTVFAADHGVTAAGVSAYPGAVTQQMVASFLYGQAAITVLCQQQDVDFLVVDVGVDGVLPNHPKLLRRKVALGTRNFLETAAMTEVELFQALQVGAEVAASHIAAGANLLAAGDMGIGNTTAATALIAVLMGAPVRDITGRGTGIDDAALGRKVAVIERALALHRVEASRPLELLRSVGGLEIAAMTGFYLQAAASQVAVVLDGFVSQAAALVAVALAPAVRGYLFASHGSQSPHGEKRLAQLGVMPIFDFSLRLGEGTGAALALPVIEGAAALLAEMATFAEAGVSESSSQTPE